MRNVALFTHDWAASMHKISVIWAFWVKNELDIADYAKEYAYTAGKKIYTAAR